MQLSDFFHPLNIQNLFLFILIVFGFDVVGFFLAQLFHLSHSLRVGFWIIGLGVFVFVWFLLHYFIPFLPEYVSITMLVLTIGGLPLYIKEKAFFSLVKELVIFPWLFLLLIPFLKPLYFLDSFPPYLWDEMAYHYYSPAQLVSEKKWDYVDPINSDSLNLFAMTPRFLDTAFVLMFAMTKTYATARLLHTSIFLTSILVMSKMLRKYLSFLPALVFTVLALYLNLTVLLGATTGYTDSGTASLLILFLASCVGWLVEKKHSFVLAMIIFGALAMGGKYTSVSFLVAGGISLVSMEVLLQKKWLLISLQMVRSHRQKLVRSGLKQSFTILLLMLVFGGYWYIKNYLVSGNPIYPFLFHCWKGVLHCGVKNDFFASWTIALAPQNYQVIIESIFQHYSLYVATVFGLTLALFGSIILKKWSLFILSLFLPLTIIVEVFISAGVSGFELRYFSHWLFFVPLLLALPFHLFSLLRQKGIETFSRVTLVICVFLFSGVLLFQAYPLMVTNIININKLERLTDNDRWFARGKMSFEQWIDPVMPHMHPLISWCGEKRVTPIQLFTADPKLLYWTEGLMKIYLVNCQLNYIKDIWNHPPEEIPHQVDKFLAEHPGVLVVSALTCEESLHSGSFPNPFMNKYIIVNRELICRGKEIRPRVYSFGASP